VSFFAYEGPSHPVAKSGKVDGLWTAGFASFSMLIAVHHLTIFMSTKAYNGWLIASYVFSILCFMPITTLLNEYTPSTQMYRTTFSDVLSSPLYWLAVGCGVTLVCAPYYALLRYGDLKWHPEHSARNQAHIVAGDGFLHLDQRLSDEQGSPNDLVGRSELLLRARNHTNTDTDISEEREHQKQAHSGGSPRSDSLNPVSPDSAASKESH